MDKPAVKITKSTRQYDGDIKSIKRFLMDFLTPILPKIVREPTRESLIEIH